MFFTIHLEGEEKKKKTTRLLAWLVIIKIDNKFLIIITELHIADFSTLQESVLVFKLVLNATL